MPKLARLLILCSALLISGGAALASSAPVDPSIILRDPTPSDCSEGVTCITSSNFTFDVGPTGGGLFDFTNNLGFTITSLAFIFENPGGITNGNISSAVNCQVLDFFQSCDKSVLSNGSIKIFFSGVGSEGCGGDGDHDRDDEGTCTGILNGTTFTLDLFNQKHHHDEGTGGWVAGSNVDGTAAVPEPSTLLLLLTCLPLVVLRKKQ